METISETVRLLGQRKACSHRRRKLEVSKQGHCVPSGVQGYVWVWGWGEAPPQKLLLFSVEICCMFSHWCGHA